MKPVSPSACLGAAFALALAVNAFALGNVWYNRSGEPDSQLRLSERELHLPSLYAQDWENSGLAVRLDWRRPHTDATLSGYRSGPLTPEQVRALGLESEPRRPHTEPQVREALVVLEQDGPAYQAELQRQQRELDQARAEGATADTGFRHTRIEDAERALRLDREKGSRLFAVDVGLDQTTLRERYPDRTRYAIVPGEVRSWPTTEVRAAYWYVADVRVDTVNIPFAWRAALHERLGKDPESRFALDLAVGKRLEPWVSDIHGLD